MPLVDWLLYMIKYIGENEDIFNEFVENYRKSFRPQDTSHAMEYEKRSFAAEQPGLYDDAKATGLPKLPGKDTA